MYQLGPRDHPITAMVREYRTSEEEPAVILDADLEAGEVLIAVRNGALWTVAMDLVRVTDWRVLDALRGGS